jgi:hypothetical protein
MTKREAVKKALHEAMKTKHPSWRQLVIPMVFQTIVIEYLTDTVFDTLGIGKQEQNDLV